MEHPCFHTPAWRLADTVQERTACLQLHPARVPDTVGTSRTPRRFDRWRSQRPFQDDFYFRQRLETQRISEQDFRGMVTEPIEAVYARDPNTPDWLGSLSRAYSPLLDAVACTESSPHAESAGRILEGLMPLINPALLRVRTRVRDLLQSGTGTPLDPALLEQQLLLQLADRLNILSRTLVLELHVARLEGYLHGDTPEERYRSFLQRIGQPSMMVALLQEYPVLARQLVIHVEHWVESALEFAERLCADWTLIVNTFAPDADPGPLVSAKAGAGDSHRRGRSVWILTFGSGLQLVYKPRDLGVEVHFQEFLTWLNCRADDPSFHTRTILNRGTHGWTEFVSSEPCGSAEELQRFYQRQGGYLALLYALRGVDFHSENLIAAGEHPVLLDLEALFHPPVPSSSLPDAEEDPLAGSVMQVGLLPHLSWATADSDGIDTSGFGAAAGQLTPFAVPVWEGVRTDEMHFTRKRIELPGNYNRPTINGREVSALDFVDAIHTGFTNVYRLLLKHRRDLLSVNGPIRRFADDEVRVILRQTQTYASLLQESFHPSLLGDALDRDRWFDSLWAPVVYQPHLAAIIPAEQRDLWGGDIPIFTTHPGSRDLWDSSHNRIPDFFDRSGLSGVEARLAGLSEEDLARQLWVVRASFATLASGAGHAIRARRPDTVTPKPAELDRLLAQACAVGDRLELLAFHHDREISWLGLMAADERRSSIVPAGLDLYDGLPGIALFLAYLGSVTGEARYTTLARSALHTVQRRLAQGELCNSVGAFDGWGGILYVLTHLAALWGDSDLLEKAAACVDTLRPLIEHDEHLDIIAGSAGCIGALIALYRYAPKDQVLSAASECGDRLLARATPMEQGIGWVTGPWRHPLAGFSHGCAGIAWALLELATLTGEERFREAAIDAIAYERTLFSAEAANWRDVRGLKGSAGENGYMKAWCHGAPGVGLGRLSSLKHLDDAAVRAEIQTAIMSTIHGGFGASHSLCHGDLGNLEFLLQAQRTGLSFTGLPITHISALILNSICRDGWICGNPTGVESPGLMTGLAGIGYGLLRLAEPERLPSVLLLEPPTGFRGRRSHLCEALASATSGPLMQAVCERGTT